MSFFAILFALLIEQARPLARSNPIHGGLRAWALSVSRNFDAGGPHHGWVAWGLAVPVPPLFVLSVHCALRAGGRHQRGGAALARWPWPGSRQCHRSRVPGSRNGSLK